MAMTLNAIFIGYARTRIARLRFSGQRQNGTRTVNADVLLLNLNFGISWKIQQDKKNEKKKQKNRPFKTRQPSRIPSFPLKSVRSRCATTRIENLQLTTEYLTVAILIFYVWQEKKNITTRDFQSIRTTFGSNEPLVSFYWYRYEIGDSLGGYVTLCKTRYKTNTSERHIWIKTYSSAIPYFVTLIIIYYNFYDLSVEKKKY